jgi:hypothetical protein
MAGKRSLHPRGVASSENSRKSLRNYLLGHNLSFSA